MFTIKFTNLNQTTDTSGWKTYNSNHFGVSFEYPPSFEIKETADTININDMIYVSLVIGEDQYFGCAIPTNKCPDGKSLVINGKVVTKNIGNATSIGGKNLLEYEFPGENPNTSEVSSINEYHLFFDYKGYPNDSNAIRIFNQIANTVHYMYGREPGPSG